MNYSEIESKVREATNDDPWGPSGQLMGDIAKATFMYEQFPELMNMLWTRMLKDNKKNWRRVYKAPLTSVCSCSLLGHIRYPRRHQLGHTWHCRRKDPALHYQRAS
ncbi:unnamed protein product [Staurois parvus]|uniref:ENTH domain-containing protein n=1 Tax=Staurois parvus TaxID=386267 RepID=A0ABN9ERB2_9NEOB|nr:unnamed protein product [Staurois parvus]